MRAVVLRSVDPRMPPMPGRRVYIDHPPRGSAGGGWSGRGGGGGRGERARGRGEGRKKRCWRKEEGRGSVWTSLGCG